MKGESLETRFWNKVSRDPEGCWFWTGAQQAKGYGLINRGEGRGKNVLAHRLSWVLAYGPIPEGMSVLHTCDNRSCVRPDHLWLGTPLDNTRDMMRKRRGRSGYAKLTLEDVDAIRARVASGEKIADIAGSFPQVTAKSVWRVATGRTFV